MKGRSCLITVVHRPLDVRIFHKQARTLAEHGWEVTLIAPGETAEQIVEGVRVLGLPRLRRWQRLLNWLRALRLALRMGADIYHVHDPELLLLAPALRVFTRKPIIYDVHEDYRLSILEKPWIPKPLRPFAGKVFNCLEMLLVRAVNVVVYVTPPIGQRYTGVARQCVQVANFAMCSQYQEEPTQERTPGLVIAVGGMTPIRGYDALLDAFKLVLETHAEAKLLLVGTADSEDYGRQLQERAHSLGIEDRVEFAGRLPFPEVRNALASASVAVLPYIPVSAHRVAYPTKLFEYMAAGVPCVASDLPLCKEIIEGARCGLVVSGGEPQALADGLLHLLKNPEAAREMGKRGRQAFLFQYTWEGEGKRLVELYDKLVARDDRE